MSQKKVSIICSLYKGKDFINHYLENIVNQKYFEEYELIIIDANSPDGEFKIISQYLRSFENIIYKKLDYDPGIYACWNIAISLANGTYINTGNVDDIKKSDSLSILSGYLDKNPDIDLVYSNSYISNNYYATFDDGVLHSEKYFNFPEFSFSNLLDCNPPHNTPLYRKSLHDRFGIFLEKYQSASDYEFWLRCAKGGSKMKKVNELLGVYYWNPNGMSTDSNNFSWKIVEEKEISSSYNHENISITGNSKYIFKL